MNNEAARSDFPIIEETFGNGDFEAALTGLLRDVESFQVILDRREKQRMEANDGITCNVSE